MRHHAHERIKHQPGDFIDKFSYYLMRFEWGLGFVYIA